MRSSNLSSKNPSISEASKRKYWKVLMIDESERLNFELVKNSYQ